MNTKLAEFKIKYENIYNFLLTEDEKILINNLLEKYSFIFVEYVVKHLNLYKSLTEEQVEYISNLDVYFDCWVVQQDFNLNGFEGRTKYCIGIKGTTIFYIVVDEKGSCIYNVEILTEENAYNNGMINYVK